MTVTAERVETVATVKPGDLRDALTACLLSAGKDMTLPVLISVQVEKTGRELIFRSTDRYRLTRVTVKLDDTADQAPDFVTLISAADAKRVLASIPKPTRYGLDLPVTVAMIDGMLTVDTSGAVMRLEPLTGEFPRTDQIWPATVAAIEGIGLDPKYLTDLAKMPGRAKKEPVRFEFAGPGKPVSSRWESGDVSYEHLLMPVRVNA